jgi:LacI family transcriptional regulator
MVRIPKVILMVEPLGEYVQGLLRGIVKYANTHGPWVFYREPGKHEGLLPQLKCQEADGIIARIISPRKSENDIPRNVPTIIIPHKKEPFDLPTIIGDCAAIGKMAAKYFMAKGFRNFAFCGFDELQWSRERGRSFANTIAAAGHKAYFYDQIKLKKDRLWENEHFVIAEWLKSLPKPLALFAGNDDRGQHVIEACNIANLNVPKDIAVLGVDNDEFVCGLSNPPLSSIAMGSQKGGYEAAKLLDSLMKGEKMANQKIMVRPTYVITRQSTDILAIRDADVADAIRFIQKHAKDNIQVSDVANALTLSRRHLERKFRKAMNCSVNDQIRSVRTEQISYMLLETDLSILQIALATGYKDVKHIARYFKQETSMTPLAYRSKLGQLPR